MALKPASSVDVLIIGNGPAALILSFMLHGNIPYYDPTHPHPDPLLHEKLSESPCLLQLDVDALTAHFDASRISYSTQALPVNVLLDTLLRPLADVEPGEYGSSIVWRKEPDRAVSHLVVGDSPQAGGQWADNPVSASWDIGALSYVDQLSLPGYTLCEHLGGSPESLCSGCQRPTRRQLTDYFAAYPAAVGIQDSIRCDTEIKGVKRTSGGFYVASHNIHCKQVVLASGIFTKLLPPPPELEPLRTLDFGEKKQDNGPILVVGSGFSAADIIISNVQKRKILHVFRWQPNGKPSPLQACHPQAYPDYASVYRQMKDASKKQLNDETLTSPTPKKAKPFFDDWVWEENYVGIPNGSFKDIQIQDGTGRVTVEMPGGKIITSDVSSLACVIGRRGSLDYLEDALQLEVLEDDDPESLVGGKIQANQPINSQTLREKAMMDVEMAKNIYAIGSLTGDSLIRFAYGGCVQAAGHLMQDCLSPGTVTPSRPPSTEKTPERRSSPIQRSDDTYKLTNGHEDLGMKREELKPEDDGGVKKPSRKRCKILGKCTLQ